MSATNTEKKEWTVMFYFASDNPLAPTIVSQLKAIKDAGFHKGVNVVARFDPHTEETPTHVFDVNLISKLKSEDEYDIGFTANDPYVRNLVADKLWSRKQPEGAIRERLVRHFSDIGYDPPDPLEFENPHRKERSATNRPIEEPSPEDSLKSFLTFCRERYPANHYILFILGHGIAVGNDLFLADEHASRRSLRLKELGKHLTDFANAVRTRGEAFELVSFHSCSMSGLEVAYELKDSANYMLASQGPAFVGSWPYRQMLIRIFNDLREGRRRSDVKTMVTKFFHYCLYNSYDFQLAGYSFDVCLTDLSKLSDTENGIKAALSELSAVLIEALPRQLHPDSVASDQFPNLLAQELILLAHWESQSYWQEEFSDLYDFCFCLKRRCTENESVADLGGIVRACEKVMEVLKRGNRRNDDTLIVRSEFAGPTYQYSHGLSIYFPWAEPIASKMWDEEYGTYNINIQPAGHSWMDFLRKYFESTQRLPKADEKDPRDPSLPNEGNPDAELLEEITRVIFNEFGQLRNKSDDNPSSLDDKSGPDDPTGGGCDCPTIKNHPRFTRSRKAIASPNFFKRLRLTKP